MNARSKLLPCGLAMACFFLSSLIASADQGNPYAAPRFGELQLAGIRLGRSAVSIIQMYGNPSEIRVGVQAQVAGGIAPAMPAMEGMPMGLPGMAAPMEMGGIPGMPQPPGQMVPQKTGPPEVIWIYRFAKNKTLEFIISPDGRVMQIAAYGVEWPGIRTSMGITLGHTYKDVLLKYGFPESHEKRGVELIAKYSEKRRVIFTLGGRTVVGITIGLMD